MNRKAVSVSIFLLKYKELIKMEEKPFGNFHTAQIESDAPFEVEKGSMLDLLHIVSELSHSTTSGAHYCRVNISKEPGGARVRNVAMPMKYCPLLAKKSATGV